jgi:phosphoribosylanthranilate isomerase
VDVASGVEATAGVKDLQKVQQFIVASRQAEPQLKTTTQTEE